MVEIKWELMCLPFFAVGQKQAMLVRQLEEELRIRSMQNPSLEMRQQVEAIYAENEHLTREVAILRETVKVNSSKFDAGCPKMNENV